MGGGNCAGFVSTAGSGPLQVSGNWAAKILRHQAHQKDHKSTRQPPPTRKLEMDQENLRLCPLSVRVGCL